jgi:GH15 family glucan-1,4-alpha-glucosidase
LTLPLEQYALIGDCQTAALVGTDRSIDWLCLPRFDSAACFAALLGTPEHGRWRMGPSEPVHHTDRRYRGDTLILETEFTTGKGTARLIDFMSLDRHVADVVRIIEGVRGAVQFQLHLTLRPDYGAVVPWVRRAERGLVAIAGPDLFRVRSSVPLVNEDFATSPASSAGAS